MGKSSGFIEWKLGLVIIPETGMAVVAVDILAAGLQEWISGSGAWSVASNQCFAPA